MLFLPKVKKCDPTLRATGKVKTVIASVLATIAVAVSSVGFATTAEASETAGINASTRVVQADMNAPLLMIQSEAGQESGSASHYSHSSHFSHSSHQSHFSHYSSRY